jgi:hypothetical protein
VKALREDTVKVSINSPRPGVQEVVVRMFDSESDNRIWWNATFSLYLTPEQAKKLALKLLDHAHEAKCQ